MGISKKSIGAFWKKQGKKGKFLSGNLEIPLPLLKKHAIEDQDGKRSVKIGVMIFNNSRKEEGSKQPDSRMKVILEDGISEEEESALWGETHA